MVGKGRWLTTGEAADLLGVSDETIRRWVIAGEVFRPNETMVTRGRHKRIAKAAVERVLAEQRGEHPSET